MGLVYVDAVIKHGDKSVPVKLLVDSGAIYTVLRRDVWEYLGLRPMQEMEFVLADGTVIKRWISEAIIELRGYGERHAPVVLGETEDENLLGTVTLEIFGARLGPIQEGVTPSQDANEVKSLNYNTNTLLHH
ncbi:retroviral-like aspartic protease family protein [Vulcanisaeta distributa]|uniref:retroviral-like aspartic protease family protein n=1 Tax=Vulcanisaeta distributa TaxID=164451 RepID=UPI000AB9DCBD|nr:retroviral-like aspartic protease family protein [Vulcanisaeta distributa]